MPHSRTRKVRCDGTKPRCNTCMRRSQTCNWTARLAPGNYQFVYVEDATSQQTPPRHIQTKSRDCNTGPRQQPTHDALPTALRQRLLHIFTQTHQMLELCGCVDIDTLKQTAGTDKDNFLLHAIAALSSLYLTDVEIASQSRFANSRSFMTFYRSEAQASSRSLSDEPSGAGSALRCRLLRTAYSSYRTNIPKSSPFKEISFWASASS